MKIGSQNGLSGAIKIDVNIWFVIIKMFLKSGEINSIFYFYKH